ncbi:MAG: SoxR reducing system RseC family protein [Clostridia bacterium]|nr:SoxR reducing system RseC family protein [Clostridia bacterium]
MKQKGTIVTIKDEKALVAVPRPSACGDNCVSCSGGCAARGHLVWLDNTCCAKEGDRVILEASGSSVLWAAAVLYGLPLLLFFMGYAVLYQLTNNTLWASAAAIAGLLAGFFIVHKLDKVLAPKPQIIEIVEDAIC